MVSMKKFEYLAFDVNRTVMNRTGTVQELLNEYGEDGWDLVSYHQDTAFHFVFKREKIVRKKAAS